MKARNLRKGALLWAAATLCTPVHVREPVPLDPADALAFVGRLRSAVESNAVREPAAFERATGVRVLEWVEGLAGARVAARLQLDVPSLQRLLDPAMGDAARAHYAVQVQRQEGPNGFLFRVHELAAATCLTPAGLESVLGPLKLRVDPRPAPLHGRPFAGPRWYVYSTFSAPASGGWLVLGFHYVDEASPKATCLAGVQASDVHPFR